ncbi:MAG: hypothetical protein EBX36_06690, partial [Planctomycetia bacterium]|nr:hypothetical protein [Planctomycetia bacterium]
MPECRVQRRSPPRAGIAVGFVAVAVAWWAGGVCAGASFPPSETLLPATTRVWVSAADPQGLKERFERSALGGLLHDPLMSTFLDDLRTRNKPSADPLRGSLEITAGEVEKVAAGEIALGVVERPDGLLATLLLVDTSGRAAATAA